MTAKALPLAEMNMTPLIDVLLVLLVMFILTIPSATQTLPVDLPVPCENCPPLDRVANTVSIDAWDRLAWNGTTIGPEQLGALLAASLRLPVEPELRFAPAARARYDAAAHALVAIRASGVSRFGFVGNEQFRIF